jgi:tetratricopeptide (TPR) repeat protein
MTTFQKLKHEARRAEQRSDWARAIDLYQRALDADEDMADLSLYNRIGDLHMRLGENEAAVEQYERAVERYADNAMHTSAIALCNKILRIAPGRASVYRRLAVLHARTGLVVEGRGNMMAYVRHVLADGEPEDAAVAVAEFVDLTDDEEICVQYAAELAERGETTAAADQLRADASEEASGSTRSTEPRARKQPDRLADLVARRLSDEGNDVAFQVEAPPTGPVSEARPDEDLAELGRQAVRFRSRVADVLEAADSTIRYDLGVEFMTIGLLEEAIEEFRFAVADPRLLEAANARIGECLALRGSDTSFEVIRRASRGSLGGGRPAASDPRSIGAVTDDSPNGTGAAGDASDDGVSAPGPGSESDEPPSDQATPEVEEDEIQGHFFRARLAQYRIRQAEERHTIDHSAHLDLGTAYVEMGLHQEALRELGAALDGPRPVSGRAVRVLERLALGLVEEPGLALEVIDRLAESEREEAAEALGRRLAEAWGGDHPLADELSELLGRLRGAVDELPALEDMFPALRKAVTNGETAPATGSDGTRDERASDAARPSVDQVLVSATELVAVGDVERAVEDLQASLARLEAGHRTREALVVLERLLELQPDDATLHQRRTDLAMMANDRDLLLAAFAGLGACLRRLGTAKRARAAYGRMLDIDPSNELARQAIARIDEAELEVERETLARDEAPSETAESSPPEEDDEELDAMLEFLDGLEDADLEIVSGEPEVEAAPGGEGDGAEDPTARSCYELGLAFRQMGMWDEALRELRPALDRVTDRLGILEALGECLLKTGRPAEAIALLQSKLRADEDPEQVGPLYFLGLALQSEGEEGQARDVFARVEAAHPGYRDTAHRLSELSL